MILGILDRQPDWRSLPPGIPARARRLIERCLQKELRRRLRDVGDALDDLEPCSNAVEPAHPQLRAQRGPVEFHRLTNRVGMNESPAISPDGKMVAYAAVADGRRQSRSSC